MQLEDVLSTLMATLLIAGIECTMFMVVYRSWLQNPSTSKTALLTVVHVLYAMLITNMIACGFTDPGRVPKEYIEMFRLNQDTGEIEPNGDCELKDLPRWCHLCAAVKPPRAHHCSSCQRCVLKMDHHCPWMGTCIGFHNHAHFVRFLVYTTLCCMFSLVCGCIWMYEEYYRIDTDTVLLASDYRLYVMVFTLVVLCGVVMFVGALAIHHMHAIALNQTTIESMEQERLSRQLDERVRFPFTCESVLCNIRQTMGDYPWLYPIPWPLTISADKEYYNGVKWPIHPDSDFGGQWPVRLKDLDILEAHDTPADKESREYRARIRKDSDGYTLPQRLFPEFYQTDLNANSDPHLQSNTVNKRRL